MPYTEKQRRFFEAAAHDPAIAREHGISHGDASKLAHEAEELRKKGETKPAIKSFIDLEPTLYPAGRG